ncbi:MAG: glycosyltransferase family 4 protein [Candidatus Paceibacterota bacterium]|jgi:glycosyltransferase involved in cell wall biosynthesis|nr:glycosyltransferase family 4 protein [Candidatus Paceibacterota bacterium]
MRSERLQAIPLSFSEKMKIAFIHNDQKLATGANQINDLISRSLSDRGVFVQHYYPTIDLIDPEMRFRGISNILFFHSLLEQKKEILKNDIIQGTTYTPIAFLPFSVPIICHFGSTTQGFLDATPQTNKIEPQIRALYDQMKADGIIQSLNIKTKRPLLDIAHIERYVASRANMNVATSRGVAHELELQGIEASKIQVIHNAIEDYWFGDAVSKTPAENPRLVFLGRIGGNPFDFKLKGLGRVLTVIDAFPDMEKMMIVMTTNKKIGYWMLSRYSGLHVYPNVIKEKIPALLENSFGDIQLNASRYEGFSLSLIEGMAMGMIPVTFPCGVAPEIIVSGENGYLVQTIEEMIKITRTISKDPKLRKTLAANARKTARQFTAEKMADEFIEVYEKVLAEAEPKNAEDAKSIMIGTS